MIIGLSKRVFQNELAHRTNCENPRDADDTYAQSRGARQWLNAAGHLHSGYILEKKGPGLQVGMTGCGLENGHLVWSDRSARTSYLLPCGATSGRNR